MLEIAGRSFGWKLLAIQHAFMFASEQTVNFGFVFENDVKPVAPHVTVAYRFVTIFSDKVVKNL